MKPTRVSSGLACVLIVAMAASPVACGRREAVSPRPADDASRPDASISKKPTVRRRSGGPTTLAVIPGTGKRLPPDAVVARLEVALSATEGVALVERTLVRRVLSEHRLSASGLTSPATSIELGKLLHADAFVFVEAIPKSKPATMRLQLVEARTGIVLSSGELTQSLGEEGRGALGLLARAAAATLDVPASERRYVSVAGFRNEEPGRMLDATAASLAMLVELDLAAHGGIVVLDRAHVMRLRAEKELTGLELDIKGAAIIVEGGVRRTDDGSALRLTLKTSNLSGGGTRSTVLEGVDRNPARARAAVTRALLAEIGAKPAGSPGDPRAEAQLFVGRVPSLLSTGDLEGATAAAEAAYALHENRVTAFWAAKTWCDAGVAELKRVEAAARQSGNTAHVTRTNEHGRDVPLFMRYENVPTEELSRALEMMVRGRAVALAFYRLHADAFDARAVRDAEPSLRIGQRRYDRLRPVERTVMAIDFASGNDEVRALRQEVGKLDRELFRLESAHYGKHAPATEDQYWLAWNRVLSNSVFPYRLEKRAELVREAAETFARPPIRTSVEGVPYRRISMLTSLPFPLSWVPDEQRPVLVKECLSLAEHRDPYVRMCAARCLTVLDHEPLESARRGLDAFTKELPLDHPYRAHYRSERATAIVVKFLLLTVAARDREAYHEYCRRVFAPLLVDEKCDRLNEWTRQLVLEDWIDRLVKDELVAEADRVVGAAFERLSQASDELSRAAAPTRWLREKHAELAASLGRSDGRDSAWGEYEVVAAPFTVGGTGAIFAGRKVYAVGRGGSVKTPESFDITVSVRDFPEGTNRRKLGRVSAACRVGIDGVGDRQVYDAVVMDGTVYVGAAAGLFLFPIEGGEPRLVTERDGLPAKGVVSLAVYDRQLYAGFTDGFARLDPATGKWTLIASASAVEVRSRLDGGEGYGVVSLLSDPARERIWVSVRCGSRTRERSGLWQYDPASGELTRAVRVGRDTLYSLRWSEHGIVACLDVMQLVLVDPDRLRATWLASTSPKRNAVFGTPGVLMEHAIYEGDGLITGCYHLYLHRRGAPPAILSTLPGGRTFRRLRMCVETDVGIYVTGGSGAFLITRNGAPPLRTPVPRYVPFLGALIR